MIAGRISIETSPPARTAGAAGEDAYNEAVNAEILDKARALAAGAPSVRVEVARPGEDWDISGDAVEVTFDPPTIVTLPPYSEVTP